MNDSDDGAKPTTHALLIGLLLATALLAGCIGTGDETALEANEAPSGDATEQTREVPYSQSGSLETALGVCVAGAGIGTNACQGNIEIHETDPTGVVEKAELTLTWEPLTPLTQELGITLAWGCDDQGDCKTDWASGTSPVELTVDGVDAPGKVYIAVWNGATGTEEAYVTHTTSQDYQIEGTFTSLVPAGGSQ